MFRELPGVLTFEVVTSPRLQRPSNRLRFVPDDKSQRYPDLYDAELQRIVEEEIIFSGIESPGPLHAMVQHYAQAWRVTLKAP